MGHDDKQEAQDPMTNWEDRGVGEGRDGDWIGLGKRQFARNCDQNGPLLLDDLTNGGLGSRIWVELWG